MDIYIYVYMCVWIYIYTYIETKQRLHIAQRKELQPNSPQDPTLTRMLIDLRHCSACVAGSDCIVYYVIHKLAFSLYSGSSSDRGFLRVGL